MPHINATFRNSSTVISTETEISASSLNALKFESLRFLPLRSVIAGAPPVSTNRTYKLAASMYL